MMNSAETAAIFFYQSEIRKAGYQWTEHIFNDGHPDDCHISLTKDKDPSYLIMKSGELGWGRFPRLDCWTRAYQYIVVEKKD